MVQTQILHMAGDNQRLGLGQSLQISNIVHLLVCVWILPLAVGVGGSSWERLEKPELGLL